MTRPLTGAHVLAGLFAFFGLMLVANGIFVYVATTTFSGLSTEDAYRKGLHYNDTLAAFHAQQSSGWQAKADLSGQTVRLKVTDKAGQPLDGLALSARLGRPATDGQDRALTFRGEGKGLYLAKVGDLAPGQWDLIAEARPYGAANAAPFKVSARLWQPQS